MKIFIREMMKTGYQHATDYVKDRKKKDTSFILTEHDLNSFAYLLLQQSKKNDALEIFKLNTYLYPGSWNAYDSEAEGYDNTGDRENAIKFYKKSLELNPKNKNAAEQLKRLESPKK